MKKIIIYGGSFDPIHNGHIKTALLALKKVNADLVYFVPSYSGKLKNINLTSAIKRYEMVKIIIRKYHYFRISKWDIKNKNLYTKNLIKYFLNKFKKNQLYLLIGADQVENFSHWKNAKWIANKVKIIYVKRKNFINLQKNEKIYNMQCIGDVKQNISSTQLRKKSLLQYMDMDVINYINDNLLYIDDRIKNLLDERRWKHCLRTAKFARQIAIGNNYINPKEAYIAGLFHDLAKQLKSQQLLKYAKKLKINNYTAIATLHPFAAYYIMKNYYLFTNQRILQAVYRHTEPNQKDLSTLDKIIYVADKCEPGRKKENINKLFNINELQQIALKNVDKAFKLIYDILLSFYQKN